MKAGNVEVSKLYLDKELNRLNTQVSEGASLHQYGAYIYYYNNLKHLVKQNSFVEIESLLKSYENSYIEKVYGEKK